VLGARLASTRPVASVTTAGTSLAPESRAVNAVVDDAIAPMPPIPPIPPIGFIGAIAASEDLAAPDVVGVVEVVGFMPHAPKASKQAIEPAPSA